MQMHHSAGLLRIPVFALHGNSTDLRPPAPRFRGTLELRSSSVLFFEYGSCSLLVALGNRGTFLTALAKLFAQPYHRQESPGQKG
jgi:hypothetical protein